MQKTLPPAATAGFAYDYQSVMHYPWMQIKEGVTNTMYPVWVSFFYTDINYFLVVCLLLVVRYVDG